MDTLLGWSVEVIKPNYIVEHKDFWRDEGWCELDAMLYAQMNEYINHFPSSVNRIVGKDKDEYHEEVIKPAF